MWLIIGKEYRVRLAQGRRAQGRVQGVPNPELPVVLSPHHQDSVTFPALRCDGMQRACQLRNLTRALGSKVFPGVPSHGQGCGADFSFQPFKGRAENMGLKDPLQKHVDVAHSPHPKSHCYYLAGAKTQGKQRHSYQAGHSTGLVSTSQKPRAKTRPLVGQI